MSIAASKVAWLMVANPAAAGNTEKQQADQPVHLRPTTRGQHMGPNALAAAGKAERAHFLVKQEEVQRVHMNFEAAEQQATNQSSWSRQGWESIALSLSRVETSESAREALRRSSLERMVLPVPEQLREEQLQLGVDHTEACHCWDVEVEAYYSQALAQDYEWPRAVWVATGRLASHTEICSPPLIALRSSPREGAAQGSTAIGRSMAGSQHSLSGVLQV